MSQVEWCVSCGEPTLHEVEFRKHPIGSEHGYLVCNICKNGECTSCKVDYTGRKVECNLPSNVENKTE